MRKEDILKDAQKIVEERGGEYGDAYELHAKIAMIWMALLDVEIAPHQVPLAMIGIKMARLLDNPAHRDSWVDIAGYAAVGAECVEIDNIINYGDYAKDD